MKFKVGIFQIKNLKNERLFLQTSEDLERAFNSDNFQLKMGLHSNKELQSDWKILGSDNFEFSILDELKPKETSTASEIKVELKEFLELHRNELLENGKTLY
ncbi:MAG: GIY-YIG nuclease family protein [Bacteroidetes bacterium]|nr:GIY-YIG nuclease family protein [Bacteroidota bacterium]